MNYCNFFHPVKQVYQSYTIHIKRFSGDGVEMDRFDFIKINLTERIEQKGISKNKLCQ